MKIKEHLDKNNLHHAYLVEGIREEIVSEIFNFLKDLNIKTSGNPDFCHITIDNFKIDEAFDLRAMSSNKSFALGHSPTGEPGEASFKKVFLVCVNSFSLDAQNVLLKMFEEPIENTHFFLVVPDVNVLLKTLVSRFYLIKNENLNNETEEAEKFINMSLQKRIDFIKELLLEPEEKDEDGNEIVLLDSSRSKALKFLNALELTLHKNLVSRAGFDTRFFEQIFKVREFLRMPGSSAKTLMESVALLIPEKIS
ncbi:MAG: hypothetical protein WC735_01225 [Candidatus Paceibacterota bacterium]|jgi:DNA polymerase III delta prime subunit